MNKQDILRKYAEYYLTNNREVMDEEDIKELELALGNGSVVTRDEAAQQCKEMKQYIDSEYEAGNDEDYIISYGDKTAIIPKGADEYEAVLRLLDTVIQSV